MKIAILISGRGSNMESILRACASGKINAKPVVVIANRDAPGLAIAKKMGIDTAIISSRGLANRHQYDQKLEQTLESFNITPRNGIICLAGFMRILGPKIVDKFKNRILNIHPSLLPSFPGLDAQRQALEHGAKVSGCTVHFVDSGVDTGPIIVQHAVKVLPNDTLDDLVSRILRQEHKAYIKAVSMIADRKIRVVNGRVVHI